jgi:hypothetical protein
MSSLVLIIAPASPCAPDWLTSDTAPFGAASTACAPTASTDRNAIAATDTASHLCMLTIDLHLAQRHARVARV